MTPKLTHFPFSQATGSFIINPEEFGEVKYCNEADKDCFLISTFSVGLTKDKDNTYDFFLKKDSSLQENNITIKWIITLNGQPIPFSPNDTPFLSLISHSVEVIPKDYGKLQVIAEVCESGTKVRTIEFIHYVKRQYPVIKQLMAKSKVQEHDLSTSAIRYIKRKAARLFLPIHINAFDALVNSFVYVLKHTGIYAKGISILNSFKISPLDTAERMTDFIDNYYLYIEAAYQSRSAGNARVPKELFISILNFLYKKRISPANVAPPGYNAPFSYPASKPELAIVEPPLIYDFNIRPGMLFLVFGPDGFNSSNPYFAHSGNIIEEEKKLYNDNSNQELLKILQFLCLFPKSALRIIFDTVCLFYNELQTSLDEQANEELLTVDTPDSNEKKEKIIYNYLIHLLDLENYTNTGNKKLKGISEKLRKTAASPGCLIIANGGVMARKLTARIEDKEVKQIYDLKHPLTKEALLTPFVPDLINPINSNNKVWGVEHFGWKPNECKSNINVNDVESWEMVLLDAGFWGHYDRSNPRRDFGIAEGKHIFLCSLLYHDKDIKETHGEVLYKLRSIIQYESLIEKLFNELYNTWGYTIEIESYTLAPPIPNGTEAFPEDRITIFFPDMHLPEKWNDIPDESVYDVSGVPTDEQRKDLREKLYLLQAEKLGISAVPDYNKLEAAGINNYLADIIKNPSTEPNIGFFNPYQYLVEYHLVERRTKMDSSWFYPTIGDVDVDADKVNNVREKVSADKLQGDPSPAIDLIALLCTINDFQTTGNKVTLVQVGDFYEMWMGKEFMYKDFPLYNSQEFPATDISLLIDGSSQVLDGFNPTGSFQYKLAKKWKSYYGWQQWEALAEHGNGQYEYIRRSTNGQLLALSDDIPLYYYHTWPRSLLTKRHKTGTSLSGSVVGSAGSGLLNFQNNEIHKNKIVVPAGMLSIYERSNNELSERIQNILDFSLPIPEVSLYDAETSVRNRAILEIRNRFWDHLEGGNLKYRRMAPLGEEFKWNKLIIELFKQNADCNFVSGNHDGYRGDPVLRSINDVNWNAEFVYSNNGFFSEHGHRWDVFNWDGMTFGAAVTNQVYYCMRPQTQTLDSVKGRIIPTFHKETIPACAQWFLLVNAPRAKTFTYRPNIEDPTIKTVQTFSVYCVGHSHTADLLTICFKKG